MSNVVIVDMLAHGPGRRRVSMDVLGAGPRTIAGVLEKNRVQPRIIPGEVFLENPIDPDDYSILFISGMASDIIGVRKVIEKWRRHAGKKPVVVGGPISMDPSVLLRINCDIAVIGEAEETVDELITKTSIVDGEVCHEELEGIKGIVFKKYTEVIVNQRRPLLSSRKLNEYRASYKAVKDYPGYWYYRVYVETVRGCSNLTIARKVLEIPGIQRPDRLYPGCAYCSVVASWGPSRSMWIERIYSEIKGLVEEGVKRIVLSAPDILDYGREEYFKGKRVATNPVNPPANTYALEKLFKTLYSIPEIASQEVSLMIENIKPCLVNEDTAGILGEYFAGTPINIGVESADEDLLTIMGRPCGYKASINAIRLLSKNKLRPYAYLIYGLPGQTEESIRKTIASLKELVRAGVEKITLYRFQPLPSSMLENASKPDPNDPVNKKLITEVQKTNRLLKQKFIGKTIKAIIVSKDNTGYWGYPWLHGPVVHAVKKKGMRKDPIGRIAKILITREKTDRVLEGVIVKIGRYIKKPSTWEI